MDSSPDISNSFQKSWQQLQEHYDLIADVHMHELFENDPARAEEFSLEFNDLFVDFSKHRATKETLELLLKLATETKIHDAINKLFTGQPINSTEQRPALHTALRCLNEGSLTVAGENISKAVNNELSHVNEFITKLHAGDIKGHSGKVINTLINIGIGGSDLGPRMVVQALQPYRVSDLKIYFVANIDPSDLNRALDLSKPETTLFCISSKSFTTLETMVNAAAAKRWLISHGCNDISKHLVAISANQSAVEDFGITPEYYFRTWDWVGGRYSLWSAVGLPIAASIGMDNFMTLLTGAREMDEHFRSSPAEKNLPIILAMLDLWYTNFFNTETHAIIPYDESLKMLPDYLGQLIMESNGKRTTHAGNDIEYHTTPIVWGGLGTNAQHAFFQLLHQGTHIVPIDFLAPLNSQTIDVDQHQLLLANCLAQSKALMAGNVSNNEQKSYREIPGNKPSTTILYKGLNPRTLGSLLALYEHRTFVQGHIWNINSFDQWGVELGKTLATSIAAELSGKTSDASHDASTRNLIERCKGKR